MLFHRLAASKDKEGVFRLAQDGQLVEAPADLIRAPYVLEFLKIPEPVIWHEKDVERRLIEQLQEFLLELGKGFAFVGKQYKIHIEGRFFRVDLVFYHRILKCHVLVDLKLGEFDHADAGQMNVYLNYYQENVSKKVANLFLKDYKESFKDILKTKYFKLFFEDFRGKPLKKFPFFVFYTIEENLKIITIKAIFHTSQNTDKYPLL